MVETRTVTATAKADADNNMPNDDVERDVQRHHHHHQQQQQQQQQHQPIVNIVTGGEKKNAAQAVVTPPRPVISQQSWNAKTRCLAAIIVVGTAASSLMNQHTANIVPNHFFAISVLIPTMGLILYPGLIYIAYVHLGWIEKIGISSGQTFLTTLMAVTPVAVCFSLHNLLVTFGTSGRIATPGSSSSSQPDVPIVLSLILCKLVVPISLLLESIHDRHWPPVQHVIGVCLVLMGIIVTAAMAHSETTSIGAISDDESSGTTVLWLHNMKILALVLCNIPLALGFLLVKRITTTTTTTTTKTTTTTSTTMSLLPSLLTKKQVPASATLLARVSEFELWAVLCLPETFFSILLTFIVQHLQHPQMTHAEIGVELWHGIKCIAFATAARTPTTSATTATSSSSSSSDAAAAACVEAARYMYLGLIPGFAYNLSIPVLVKTLGDSTVIPLLRAVALPLAATMALTGIDPVILGGSSSSSAGASSSFSWHTMLGLLLAFAGLLVFTQTTTTTTTTTKNTPSSSR
jgi:hypothetical protein